MFNSISWQLFFTTIASLVGAYYFITVLLLYSNEIKQWWKSLFNKPLENSSSLQEESLSDVMGNTAQPISHSAGEEKIISNTSSSTATTDVLIGTVADLLQEIKALIQLTIENNWDKAQCQSLFQSLFARYSILKNTSHQQSVSEFIADASSDEFPFDLSTAEVMTWWE